LDNEARFVGKRGQKATLCNLSSFLLGLFPEIFESSMSISLYPRIGTVPLLQRA
jgi:hypothetical protein